MGHTKTHHNANLIETHKNFKPNYFLWQIVVIVVVAAVFVFKPAVSNVIPQRFNENENNTRDRKMVCYFNAGNELKPHPKNIKIKFYPNDGT